MSTERPGIQLLSGRTARSGAAWVSHIFASRLAAATAEIMNTNARSPMTAATAETMRNLFSTAALPQLNNNGLQRGSYATGAALPLAIAAFLTRAISW